MKNLEHGDSCNAARLSFSSHFGGHVDAPLHFIAGGRTIEGCSPEDWSFQRPLLLDLSANDAELINASRVRLAA